MVGIWESNFEGGSFHRNIAANNQLGGMVHLHAGDENLGRLAGMPAEQAAQVHLADAACLS